MRLLDMTFPRLNRRAVRATVAGQTLKVCEEFAEVIAAFVAYTVRPTNRNAEHFAEECVDLMLSTEGLFCKLPEIAQFMAVSAVKRKGDERGDWCD